MKDNTPGDDLDFSDLEGLDDLDLGGLDDLDALEPLPELPDDSEQLPELPADALPLAAPAAAPRKPAPKPVAPKKPAAPVPPPAAAKPAAPKPAPVPAKPVAKAPIAKPEEPVAKPVEPVATPATKEEAPVLEPIAASEVPPPAPPTPTGPGGDPAAPGGKRELERAPLLLRKAAIIVAVGSLLPWSTEQAIQDGQITWAGSLGAKALLLAACFVIYQSHVATHGGKVFGPLAAIGKISIPLGKKGKLNALMIVALVLGVAGLMPLEGAFLFKAFAEKAILLLAGYTFAHIYDYEHGGRFNPIYPIMFTAPAFSIFAIFQPGGILGKIGAATVGLGGILACYTLGLAMVQAKKEGDAKRLAAREARKASRATKGGGRAPRPARAPRPSADGPKA